MVAFLVLVLLVRWSAGVERKVVARQLQRQLRATEGEGMTVVEAELWLEASGDDREVALRRMREKVAFRKSVGRVSMRDCAQFFGSDGFTVALEGLRSREGQAIVYSYGIPRGNAAQIQAQTVYLQERVLAMAQTCDQVAALKVIDTRSSSFRAPDRALRRGGLEVMRRYYPWSTKGTTVFVAAPSYVKMGFDAIVRPIFPAHTFDNFRFVDDFDGLAPNFVDRANLPKRWGGDADWSLRLYVPARCLKERTFCKPAPRNL